MKTPLFSSMLFFMAALAHAEADNQFVERHTCRNGNDERVLQVLPVEKGCTLEYIKAGKAEEKAKSVRSVEICQKALLKIRERLEKSGYTCTKS